MFEGEKAAMATLRILISFLALFTASLVQAHADHDHLPTQSMHMGKPMPGVGNTSAGLVKLCRSAEKWEQSLCIGTFTGYQAGIYVAQQATAVFMEGSLRNTHTDVKDTIRHLKQSDYLYCMDGVHNGAWYREIFLEYLDHHPEELGTPWHISMFNALEKKFLISGCR